MLKNIFKRIPYKEQSMCERKLTRVMKGLKVEEYTFNWDRNSCFIEFHYQDQVYRLDHSIDEAKKRGIILRNGLDCLAELTQSLEDLCSIIDRGTYKLETWISGMKRISDEEEVPEYEEEFHIRYKSSGRQHHFDPEEEFGPFAQESESRDMEIDYPSQFLRQRERQRQRN
ncbi:hypothetical protein [Sediminibacillus massiliensis]|uniref:hypothetical protein n=1 Tax=Sediminibacillus massiliensis TaxID=1926277 RepID=UPI0009886206|nr:hypothetical protein [Sediminibacillus massiliensis]